MVGVRGHAYKSKHKMRLPQAFSPCTDPPPHRKNRRRFPEGRGGPYTGYKHFIKVSFEMQFFTAVRLAQSVERLTAEREVVGSIPWAGPTLRVLK